MDCIHCNWCEELDYLYSVLYKKISTLVSYVDYDDLFDMILGQCASLLNHIKELEADVVYCGMKFY